MDPALEDDIRRLRQLLLAVEAIDAPPGTPPQALREIKARRDEARLTMQRAFTPDRVRRILDALEAL